MFRVSATIGLAAVLALPPLALAQQATPPAPAWAQGRPDSMAASPPPLVRPPDAFTFAETVNTFCYQAHWIAKKLRRGELAVAHECLDGYARMLLRTLIRWHAERAGDTWHKSRFMEEWADAVVIDRIPDTYALHTRQDIFRALGAMMDLVGWLTREIAATYGFVVPEAEERAVRELVAALA